LIANSNLPTRGCLASTRARPASRLRSYSRRALAPGRPDRLAWPDRPDRATPHSESFILRESSILRRKFIA
jgi:hypothetical protein